MDQQHLVDVNLYKVISKCFIKKKRPDASEIIVVYTDGVRETIWTYNPMRYGFSHYEFIGKTKIEAVFYCDGKHPRSLQLF
jgi:hypothetical protein